MNNYSHQGLPPQNIDAEDSLLSHIIIDNSLIVDAIDVIVPDDFYRTAHKQIFKAIVRLFHKKEPVDIVTLSNELKGSKQLDGIGGMAYLASLVDSVPLAINVDQTAKIIKNASVSRQIIAVTKKISNTAYDSTANVDELLEDATSQLLNIQIGVGSVGFTTFEDASLERIAQIEEMSRTKKFIGIKTGFSDIDRMIGGFHGATFILIAARPRIGKSALMMNFVNNMAGAGHIVGIFSLEMDLEALIDRQIASKSNVNLTKFTSGQGITKENWTAITEANAEMLYKYKILFDDTGGLSVRELKRRAKQMVRDGVEIIFIDQLSKITGGKGVSEYEKKTYIVDKIACLTKELRIPICLLAQINRKLEDRSNKKPTLGDLKSTGSLEEDTDIVFLGHRQYEYTKAEADLHHAEWEIAKNKQGPEANVEMSWDGKTVTFNSITRDY